MTGCGIVLRPGRIRKQYFEKWKKQVKMTKEVYRRLNGSCRGIVYPIEYLSDGVVYPYFAERKTLDTIKMTKQEIHAVLSFAIHEVAPCVARQGLVFFDVTTQHMLWTGNVEEPIMLYDVDLWRRREWYNSSVSTATKQNQYLLKVAFEKYSTFSILQNIPGMRWDQSSCCWWNKHNDPWKYMNRPSAPWSP